LEGAKLTKEVAASQLSARPQEAGRRAQWRDAAGKRPGSRRRRRRRSTNNKLVNGKEAAAEASGETNRKQKVRLQRPGRIVVPAETREASGNGQWGKGAVARLGQGSCGRPPEAATGRAGRPKAAVDRARSHVAEVSERKPRIRSWAAVNGQHGASRLLPATQHGKAISF